MRTRTRAGTAALGAITLLATSLLPLTAHAADGPPPASAEKRVLSKVHTDAVSTFLDGTTFELATKADVPEGNGTRFDPTDVLFHLDDGAQLQVPAGYEFLGPVGSTVWMAPETNPSGADGYTQLWPGFSTESVPAGALVRDETTFTLTDLEGPGELELFSGGGLGQPKRLWSSDEGIGAFTIGRTHMHANWAFTAAGTYTLHVRAQATTTGGAAVSADNVYTFVVGELPAPVATTTTLTASTATAVPGDTVTLSSTVTPAGATGWVEFLDGTTPLGHAEVVDGAASLDVTTLPLGARSITARFAPALLNDFAGSTSEPTTVTVTEETGGDEFGIAGFRESYAAGDLIHLRPQGVTPGADQHLWWLIRESETDTEYLIGQDVDFIRDATTGIDGAQIALVLRGPVDGKQQILQQSAWATLRVTGANVGSGQPITLTGVPGSAFAGDPIEVTAEHAPLTAGQSYAWVSRAVPYGGQDDWYELWGNVPTGTNPFQIDTGALTYAEIALRIVAEDGTVVGQSPAIRPDVASRELLLSGARSVYRDGETLELSSELFPARPDVAFQWGTGSSWDFAPIDGQTQPTLSMPVTAAMDGTTVSLRVLDATTGFQVAEAGVVVRVTDASAGEQLVLLDALAAHYHQGNTVALRATADPVAGDTDTYRWEWKRPDQGRWATIPGATTASHDLEAEQALDGTEVRATLITAGGDELATSETVTIHVDDHGAAPVQKATVTGLKAAYEAGDQVELTAGVSPSSVLDRWEWHLQRPGSDTPALLDDSLTSNLTFQVTEELDGAAIFARLTFDDATAYVESAPVVLTVNPAQPGEPDPTTPPTDPTDPPVDPTDPPVDPTDPPVDPTDPPTDPADPAEPGVSDPKPAQAPAPRTGAELDGVAAGGLTLSTTSPRQGQVVTVQLGAEHADEWVAAWMFSTPTLLGGDWVQADAAGSIAVRIPADAPVGEHRVAVFAADGTLIGWTAVQVDPATGATPTDSLAVTGSSATPLVAVIALLLLAGAGALVISRRGRTTIRG
jgi:surface-anchored protein